VQKFSCILRPELLYDFVNCSCLAVIKMKKILPDLLRSWFGFTRRERRSSFFLLALTLAIAGTRLVIPARDLTIEEVDISTFGSLFDSAIKSGQYAEKKDHF